MRIVTIIEKPATYPGSEFIVHLSKEELGMLIGDRAAYRAKAGDEHALDELRRLHLVASMAGVRRSNMIESLEELAAFLKENDPLKPVE